MNDERIQAEIQAAINELVASGAEIGLQVAVIKNGRVVADAMSRTADPRTGVAVSGDTLFWAASTAKGVVTSVAHVLVERDELDYDMRVIDAWPEFGASQLAAGGLMSDAAGTIGKLEVSSWPHREAR